MFQGLVTQISWHPSQLGVINLTYSPQRQTSIVANLKLLANGANSIAAAKVA
jgi:hypothetical protein